MKTGKYLLISIFFMAMTANYAKSQNKCNISHQECHKVCYVWSTEPNSKCREWKKVCYTICDDFDVHVSGQKAKISSEPVEVSGKLGLILDSAQNETRFNLRLDKPLHILGEEIMDIEVFIPNLEKYVIIAGNIKITGTIEWQPSLIKGAYPVIKASNIESQVK
jgi:hypothetical protein